jgi:hypothetical protein
VPAPGAGGNVGPPRAWGVVKVPFYVPTLAELRLRLPVFELRRRHFGVEIDASLAAKRDTEAGVALARGVARDARRYLQQGSPNHTRPRLWELALDAGADADDRSRAWLTHLRKRVAGVDLCTDHLIAADVARLANADDSYFVFEDIIKVCVCVCVCVCMCVCVCACVCVCVCMCVCVCLCVLHYSLHHSLTLLLAHTLLNTTGGSAVVVPRYARVDTQGVRSRALSRTTASC